VRSRAPPGSRRATAPGSRCRRERRARTSSARRSSPRQIALTADEFNSYLKEDGIPDILNARTLNGELGVAVRERYQKHVKAVLQVGDTRTEAYAAVLGYPAEIIPLSNPYAAKIGDTLAVRALVDASRSRARCCSPAASATARRSRRTGRAATPPASRDLRSPRPGSGTSSSYRMVPVSGDSVNYESKWATLTFEVR
jgi:hypothetical protein